MQSESESIDWQATGKNSILNVFVFFFVFETPLKDFPVYSDILLNLCISYLQHA